MLVDMLVFPSIYLLFYAGSSRQFAGFNTEVDETIIDGIWKRAAEFYPKLRDLCLADFISNRKVRIGLRPYSKSISFHKSEVGIFLYCQISWI